MILISSKEKTAEQSGKILDLLPADKQNIVYTNRRSKETQGILDKILKAPEEIKVDKAKEQEAELTAKNPAQEIAAPKQNNHRCKQPVKDSEALELVKKYDSFNGKTPSFLINKGILVNID